MVRPVRASQTIANMIGALLHVGKTVLFVSEKAAALEVVRYRLAQAGLDNYLLELHNHKSSRKEVATARIFGWTRRGPDITARLSATVQSMVLAGTLAGDATTLRLREGNG